MSYTKTIWNEKTAPGISGAKLNKIEQGIYEAHERISNLALTPGGSTGDAELADIRVGVDGTTYTNAGDAVRGQVAAVDAKINEVNGQLTSEIADIDDLITKGKNVFEFSENGERTENELTVTYSENTITLNGKGTGTLFIPINKEFVELGNSHTLSIHNLRGERSGSVSCQIRSNSGNYPYASYATHITFAISNATTNSNSLHGSGEIPEVGESTILTLGFQFYDTTFENYAFDIQLEKGELTDYEPPRNVLKDSYYVSEKEVDEKIENALSNHGIADTSPMRFIVLSDPHVGDDTCVNITGIEYAERMNILVNSLNAEIEKKQVDFILCLGDISYLANENYLNYWCDNVAPYIKAPIYSLPGNHDKFTEAVFLSNTNCKRQYVLETDRFYIFCMDSYQDFEGDNECNNVIAEEFENLYNTYTDKPIILAMHYWDYTKQSIYPGESLNVYISRFERVKLVLTGHGHYWSQTQLSSGAYHLEIGCFTCSHKEDYYSNLAETQNTDSLWGFNIIETDNGFLKSYKVQPAINYTVFDMPYTISQELNLCELPAKPIADKIFKNDKIDFYLKNKIKSIEARLEALES